MDQITQAVKSNSGILSTVAFLGVLIAILYVVYTYLYPADDPTYTQFLKGEADARKPVNMKKTKVPAIYTGGDFTLSFWVYIDDWNYKTSSSKFLFAISPELVTLTSSSPLVGVLTPLQNGLMVRAATVGSNATPQPGSAPAAGSPVPDITTETNLQNLLNQQTSMAMFQSTVDTPCDIKEVPLQRWVCITIVSSGRVLDVYMDGKLGRSCVLDNVLNVPRGPLQLRLGGRQSFGGRYSSVQMWNQQLTPDLIYGIYQMGPTQTKNSVFTDLAKYLNLNVTFTGPAPGSTVTTTAPSFGSMFGSTGSCDLSSLAEMQMNSIYGEAKNAYKTNGESLMARL